MPGRKKDFKQKLGEMTYGKPDLEKRVLAMRKNFGEISSMLNDKKKK